MNNVVSINGERIIQREVDAAVVAEIEDLLAQAKSGELVGIAFGYINHDKTVGYAKAGWFSYALSGLLMMLASRISRELDKQP